ncbi:hypothetical protein Tco_1130810 [Tanacetum coccineum]
MEYVEVISDSEEVINVTPLAIKSLIVIGNHIAKKMWDTMRYTGQMEAIRLIYTSYGSTRPGFDDLILWGDMKVMFEPDEDFAVWKNHHSQELIEWKLYDSCGVHSLMLTEVTINMLVEKKYPLPQDILVRILRWKLHVNNDVTKMAYEILRFTRSQLYQQ